jgi:hypothetical protein
MSETSFIEKFLQDILPCAFVSSGSDRLRGALETMLITDLTIGETDDLIKGISKFVMEDTTLPDSEVSGSYSAFIEKFGIIREALKKLRE